MVLSMLLGAARSSTTPSRSCASSPRTTGSARAAQITQIAATTMARQDHVIICGYGRSGQNLARLLEAEDIAFIALDSDPQRVREAAGDGSSRRLRRRGPQGGARRRRAREGARRRRSRSPTRRSRSRSCITCTQVRPELPVVVRTLDDTELDRLLDGGRGRGGSGSARRQPDARDALAAAARRAAQPRAGAHPRDPRGALQPVPRLLPRRDRRRRRRRQPAAAAALGACCPIARTRSARRSPTLDLDGLVEVTGVRRKGARSQRARRRTGSSRPATSSCCSGGRRISRSPSSGC